MEGGVWAEARLAAESLACGAGLMALYDLLRVFRMAVRHSWLLVGAEDLIYWAAAGFAVFDLLYEKNDGQIRLFVIVCVFLSMAVYDRAVSVNLLKVLKKSAACFKIKIFKRK